MVVLTGFAALAIDSGVGYDQSRIDQDVSDAAALAAAYYIYANVNNAGASLGGAYAAAENVASMDCTGPSAPCTLMLSFFGSSWTSASPGTPLCTATSQSQANLCSVALANVAYAGATVGSTGHDYFANLDPAGPRTFSVGNQAVAQVEGGSGSGGDGEAYLSCVLCILAKQGGTGLTIPSGATGLDMTTQGANIDINGGFNCASGDTVTINTQSGPGGNANGTVDIAGAGTYVDNCSLTWSPSSNPHTGASPIPDPLANLQMPSPSYYSTCTASLTITTTTSINPGCYGQITIDSTSGGGGGGPGGGGVGCPGPGQGIDVTFNSGLYVIYGGLTIEGNGTTVASAVCDSANGGDTLDFVCQTSNYNGTGQPGPAACASGGQAGAELNVNVDGGWQWNLFPPTSGPWANMIILYDRNNTSPIITATAQADPDSDHNGGIYAASATYETLNYGSTGAQVAGSSETTALGSPIVVDYMEMQTNYSGGAGPGGSFQLNNDVKVPAGGPGGLVA
jgi:hypothetical protein